MGDRTLLLVLFVTTPLSSLLDEDSVFLKRLLGIVFPKLEVGQELDLLAAVVDRIPHVPDHYLKDIRSDTYIDHGLGSDGISFLVCDSLDVAPDLWTPRQETHERESMDIEQRSTISFFFQPSRKWRKWAAEKFPPVVYTSHLLELPLANTMFHNAQTSTMSAQRWTLTQNGQNPEFNRIKQTPLTQQTLNLGMTLVGNEPSVILPLTPITVSRRVTAAMGNIIRRIQTGDSPTDHAPASEELEKSIQSHYERHVAERRVDVWALVTPSEIWVSRPQKMMEKGLYSNIANGARLHKVLSGGGGWGLKQGLLSLDPRSTYSRSDQASQLTIKDDGDVEAEKQAALGEIVKPGDVVQFFAHLPRTPKDPLQDLSDTQIFKPVRGFRTTIFGTIPSTMDAMPDPSTPSNPDPAHGSLHHMFAHMHFGALSEQGMSMTVTIHNANDPTSTAPIGVRGVGTVVQTKLDVPGTRFAWVPSQLTFFRQLELLRAEPTTGTITRLELHGEEGGEGERVRKRVRVPVLPTREDGDGGEDRVRSGGAVAGEVEGKLEGVGREVNNVKRELGRVMKSLSVGRFAKKDDKAVRQDGGVASEVESRLPQDDTGFRVRRLEPNDHGTGFRIRRITQEDHIRPKIRGRVQESRQAPGGARPDDIDRLLDDPAAALHFPMPPPRSHSHGPEPVTSPHMLTYTPFRTPSAPAALRSSDAAREGPVAVWGEADAVEGAFPVSGEGFAYAAGRPPIVGGGEEADVAERASTIGGGEEADAAETAPTIAGGEEVNTAERAPTIGEGEEADAAGRPPLIGEGGEVNTAERAATIGGGEEVDTAERASTIAEGGEVDAAERTPTIGGEEEADTAERASIIGEGGEVDAAESAATIGGGEVVDAAERAPTIGEGDGREGADGAEGVEGKESAEGGDAGTGRAAEVVAGERAEWERTGRPLVQRMYLGPEEVVSARRVVSWNNVRERD